MKIYMLDVSKAHHPSPAAGYPNPIRCTLSDDKTHLDVSIEGFSDPIRAELLDYSLQVRNEARKLEGKAAVSRIESLSEGWMLDWKHLPVGAVITVVEEGENGENVCASCERGAGGSPSIRCAS